MFTQTMSIQWITIMCIKRHVSLIEMCVIRRLSAMFVRKLLEPAIDYFFLWRKMPSSMKVALSTNIMQLVSSIVIPHCVLQCILPFWLGSRTFRQGKVKGFPSQYMAAPADISKTKDRHSFWWQQSLVVGAQYLNKAYMFKLGLT